MDFSNSQKVNAVLDRQRKSGMICAAFTQQVAVIHQSSFSLVLSYFVAEEETATRVEQLL